MKKTIAIINIAFIAVVIFVQNYIYQIIEKRELSTLVSNEVINVSTASSTLSDWFWKGFVDLKYLSSLGSVQDYVEEQDTESMLEIEEDFFKFSDAMAVYDQIRLLDKNGFEKVRVDLEKGETYVIPEDELQDKSERYYFIECNQIPAGEYFVSPIDLNMEDCEIEIPYKPMVRICTPVFDDVGDQRGVLLLNYLASQMLEKFSAVDEDLMLVNQNGYWLYSPNSEDEWGFMFDEGASFAERYADEWQIISDSTSGDFESENGLWIYKKVNLIIDSFNFNQGQEELTELVDKMHGNDVLNLTVISYVSNKEISDLRLRVATPFFYISLIIYPLIYFGSWNFGKRYESEEKAANQAHYLATHDVMTKLFNRAFFDTELERLNASRLYPISVFMIDANDLKKVNDSYGHAEGDKLIQSIATVLKTTFRTEDIVARLGGDEFGVLLPQTNKEQCKLIYSRLLANIEDHNYSGEGREVDVAIGVATSSEGEALEDVYMRADKKMYAAKAAMKQQRK